MELPKIFIISGKKRSGKDTLANYLVNNYKYYKMSLSDSLKDITSDLIHLFYRIKIPKYLLYTKAKDNLGYSIEHRGKNRYISMGRSSPGKIIDLTRDTKKEYISIRHILQQIGTEICRKHLSTDIWSIVIENKIKKLEIDNEKPVRVVIPDCRFINEYNYFKEKFNTIGIRIIRNIDDIGIKVDEHVSEKVDFDIDHIIYNNKSIDDLYKSFESLIKIKKDNKYKNKIMAIQI